MRREQEKMQIIGKKKGFHKLEDTLRPFQRWMAFCSVQTKRTEKKEIQNG